MTGIWQGLVNQPNFNTSTMFLLTDGRVMVQEEGQRFWHALTPDSSGSYVNGTWSVLKPMSTFRRYYASAVLRDGRLIVIGGEYSGQGGDTNTGEIYDPVLDTWTPIPPPPGWFQVGDAASCLFPDGRFMIGALLSPECTIYDPLTNSWTPATNKAVRSNEEAWVLQPDDTILTIQCWKPYKTEKYLISANMWKDEGALPVQIVDPVMHEMGPGVLMYNGKTIFFGAADERNAGRTVLYTPPSMPSGTGTWLAGPPIPPSGKKPMVSNDCPAILLVNGKVLFTAANYVYNNWGSPPEFYVYDPASNTIASAPTPANNAIFPSPQYSGIYWSRMLLLPNGEVLFSASSKNVQSYIPDGGPQEAWRPTISAVIPHGSPIPDYYLLKGTQLNGLSQACMYGDDCANASNYPIVRLTDTHTGKVYYCRTYDFSTMGVATGGSLQSTRFSLHNVPFGEYELCVVANGISSHCIRFCYCREHACDCEHQHDPCCRHEGHRCECDCECGCHQVERRPDPAVYELQGQVKHLQNSLERFMSVSGGETPQTTAKQARQEEEKEES